MLRNKTFIRIFAVIALTAFVAVAVIAAVSPMGVDATSVEDAQRRQEEATQNKDKAQKSQNEEIKRREELDKQITALQVEIDEYERQIELKVQAIAASEQKITELSYELQEQNYDYNERARQLIIEGDVSYLEILLRSKSLDDMLSRIEIVQSIAEYDSNKLDEIKESMTEVTQMKDELLFQKEEVITLKAELDVKKAELDGYRAESQKIIDELQKDIETYEREYELAKQAEAQARAEAERRRQQTDIDLPANYTAGQFHWPSNTTYLVTSPYGYRIHPVTGKSRFHAGIDIGAAYGTSILAADAGKVIVAGYNAGGYGNYVVINHGGGFTTLYAHCSSLNVRVGDTVSRGQVIAKCGSTGMSTGPHIHFEVQVNGATTNPMQYFN